METMQVSVVKDTAGELMDVVLKSEALRSVPTLGAEVRSDAFLSPLCQPRLQTPIKYFIFTIVTPKSAIPMSILPSSSKDA